ncbi:hypothetical protein [Pseudoflavitalea rhizosphaerae]|uniref:hypothetical protein n=1 Tax=Pseudoflavitalea rhizosphaerae TaxID=1884793 RepID=UPI000F8E9817|nr:hypothetical protein [Pseudoflavitalea rhizosphaerae]
MGTKKRSPYYNQPVHLNVEQLRKPEKVVREFWTSYHLDDFRTFIEEFKEVALTNDCEEYAEPRDRSNFLFFTRQLVLMAEASYLLIKDELPASYRTTS